MTWNQNYDPLHSWPLSTLVSALPVLTLFFVLLVLRKRVWMAALCGMLVAIGIALGVFRMPALLVASACGLGVQFGLLRIAWIIVASIFLYNVAVETGQFQVMKESIAALSSDRRLQLILIAFCFGAFLEGMGGGGAPVAIAGSFLIGLGFEPFQAATLCLIANTAPVAWGGVGTPIRTLAGVTGLPEASLCAMTGRILPPLSAILPLWLVRSMVGWRETWQVWPALVVSGLTFAATQFYWSNYQETGLVDVVAALASLLAMVAFLKIWRPAKLLENVPGPRAQAESTTASAAPTTEETPAAHAAHADAEGAAVAALAGESAAISGAEVRAIRAHTTLEVLRGWSPFLLASVFIFVAGYPSINKKLTISALKRPVPYLHQAVIRVPPVASEPVGEDAFADFNVLALPGTAVFLSVIVAALGLGMRPVRVAQLFVQTVMTMMPSLLAISFMVGLAYVTRYSGMDTVLGLSLTRTGAAYPFFGTLLGWLGVALTGTDAGSNALFGNLQRVTAERLGLNPVLMASANSSGGVMGKMIDAQSIVVSSTATRQVGNEAAIFKAVFTHSILLASLVGCIVMAYSFLMPWIIPR